MPAPTAARTSRFDVSEGSHAVTLSATKGLGSSFA